MESMLAAYGSGAAKASHDRGQRILNIDIGGGTTKLALVERGERGRDGRASTSAAGCGGRRRGAASRGSIPRAATRRLPASIGSFGDAVDRASSIAWPSGWPTRSSRRSRSVRCRTPSSTSTSPIRSATSSGIDGVMFSGGVGEYVYGREARDFGDLGRRLGRAMRARLDAGELPWPLLPAGECIRATALGASEYSVQLSRQHHVHVASPASCCRARTCRCCSRPYRFDEAIDAGRARRGDPRALHSAST